MTSHKRTLRKGSLIIYAILVIGAIILYLLKIPWQENVRIMLSYYGEISICFFIISAGLIPLRLIAVEQKGVATAATKIRFLGPIVDLSLEPLFDASLFYAALFILYTIFQEHGNVLSLDPFLILIMVAGILLYESINSVYEMALEIFYAKKAEVIIRK